MVGQRAATVLTAPMTWNVNSTLDGTTSLAPILLPQLASGGDATELIQSMILAKVWVLFFELNLYRSAEIWEWEPSPALDYG